MKQTNLSAAQAVAPRAGLPDTPRRITFSIHISGKKS